MERYKLSLAELWLSIITLINKALFVFNLNFDASQLAHAGFHIDKNRWFDIALLARVTYNDRLDKGSLNLETLALNYLDDYQKRDYLTELKKAFSVRGKEGIYSAKGAPYHPTFQAYALNDVTLTIKLHQHLFTSPNYQLWETKLSKLHYLQWCNGFQGIQLDIKDLNHRISEMKRLRSSLLDLLPNIADSKSTSTAKSWNSPQAVDKWLRATFSPDTLAKLSINEKSGWYCLDNESREILSYLVPDNPLLKVLSDFHKKDKILGQLKNIRANAEGNLLRYGYKMAGTVTGRFTTASPAFHNFAKREPKAESFCLAEEQDLALELISKRYCLRNLLIQQEGVFSLDFQAQEDRMSTYLVENPRDAEVFIANRDIHGEKAKELHVVRDIAKMINHGLRYGMGIILLAARLKVSIEKAQELIEEFWRLNPELASFRKDLSSAEAFETPLYHRKMSLRGHAKVNWVIQGSCAELIWKALTYLYQHQGFKVLPHFHDELVVKCLQCPSHNNEVCPPANQLITELEALYPFTWPNTDIKVFKLGVK